MNITIINEDDQLIKSIENILINCNKNINGCKIMIIGYNNISNELIKVLKNFNCYIIVSIQDILYKEELNKLKIRNCLLYDYLSMEVYLKNSDIIINTISNYELNDIFISFINKNVQMLNIKNINNSKKYIKT